MVEPSEVRVNIQAHAMARDMSTQMHADGRDLAVRCHPDARVSLVAMRLCQPQPRERGDEGLFEGPDVLPHGHPGCGSSGLGSGIVEVLQSSVVFDGIRGGRATRGEVALKINDRISD